MMKTAMKVVKGSLDGKLPRVTEFLNMRENRRREKRREEKRREEKSRAE